MNRKRIVSMILVSAVTLTLGLTELWAGGGKQQSDSGSGDKMTELVWAFKTWGAIPPDMDKVEKAINTYLAPKGIQTKLLPIGFGDWDQKINLMLASSSEQLDLINLMTYQFSSYMSKGQLLPLDDFINGVGKATAETVGTAYLAAGQVDGIQYAIPSLKDMARGFGFIITQEYVDKYKLDMSGIKKIEDLTGILAIIKKNEPNFYPLAFDAGGVATLGIHYDSLGDNLGVLMGNSSNTVVNLYETPQYKQMITLMRSWYEAGYMSRDVAARTEGATAQLRAGTACCQFTSGKPGILLENEMLTGRKAVFVNFNLNFTMTQNIQNSMWGIPHSSKDPKKAYILLNLLFTDPALINLIDYGIEGVHYIKNTDGTIRFPEGVTAANSRYNLQMQWQLGNQYLSYVQEGNPPDLYRQLKDFNDKAIMSPALGFSFDNSKVTAQISALMAVQDQYTKGLEMGSMDTALLDEFNAKLKSAGLADVIAEKQRQYDAWRAGKK